jgi:hypothetical protein
MTGNKASLGRGPPVILEVQEAITADVITFLDVPGGPVKYSDGRKQRDIE